MKKTRQRRGAHVGSLLRGIPNDYGDKVFDFHFVCNSISNSLSDFHRSRLSLQSVKQKILMGVDCQISFKKTPQPITKWAVGSKYGTAVPGIVCSVCTRLEILPDTFSKKQVYSNVPAKVKDKHKETQAQWDDRIGMESMKEAIKQILLITLLPSLPPPL